MEREGGVGSHISPIIGISEIGTLMHRLDYKLITVNSDLNTLHFDSMMHLMYFLK